MRSVIVIMRRRSQRTGTRSQTMAPAPNKTTSLEVLQEGEEGEEGRGGNLQLRNGSTLTGAERRLEVKLSH